MEGENNSGKEEEKDEKSEVDTPTFKPEEIPSLGNMSDEDFDAFLAKGDDRVKSSYDSLYKEAKDMDPRKKSEDSEGA